MTNGGQVLKYDNQNIMSYKGNLDIVLSLNCLRTHAFRKQGYLRFRISLKQTSIDHQNKIVCQPYNIFRSQNQQQQHYPRLLKRNSQFSTNQTLIEQTQEWQSYIDHEGDYYYSRLFQTKFSSDVQPIGQSCFFRIFIDPQHQSQLHLRVELLFAPDLTNMFTEIGAYQSLVHQVQSLCTFLPILFDQFGGFTIDGLFQTICMEYRFCPEENQNINSFPQYLSAATNQLNRPDFQRFYEYYRTSLEHQLQNVQTRHCQMLNLLNINSTYAFLKLSPNYQILQFMQTLNDRTLARQRSQERLNYLTSSFSSSNKLELACDEITKDFLNIKGLLHQKWNELIILTTDHLCPLTQHYSSQYDSLLKDRLRSHVFSHKVNSVDWTCSKYQDSGKQLLKQAEMDKMKQKQHEMWRQVFPIQNIQYFEQEKKNIKIFEEIYYAPLVNSRKNSFDILHQNQQNRMNRSIHSQDNSYSKLYCSEKYLRESSQYDLHLYNKGQHIIIFVHGYQASRQDFVLFKSCLEIRYKCRVFISSANEGRTEDSIQILGKRLALELSSFFKSVDFAQSPRITFVGHSMGGIIIRSALTYIKNVESFLYSYISFSSPHLGYLYEPSPLVQAGLWFLNTWQKSQSLQELCMRDSEDPRKTLLYTISRNNCLKPFKFLAFISSSQDEYVPYESARIERNQKLLSSLSPITCNVIHQMVSNLIGQINTTQISRMNIIFNIETSNFDSLVGRTAHVKYLSDQKFIKMFCLVFDKFFA